MDCLEEALREIHSTLAMIEGEPALEDKMMLVESLGEVLTGISEEYSEEGE